jgi:serine/threonine-protein kinase SRPK3
MYELVLAKNLFRPRKGKTWTPEDDHLAQMIEVLGDFPAEFLVMCLKRDEYFEDNGIHPIQSSLCVR